MDSSIVAGFERPIHVYRKRGRPYKAEVTALSGEKKDLETSSQNFCENAEHPSSGNLKSDSKTLEGEISQEIVVKPADATT